MEFNINKFQWAGDRKFWGLKAILKQMTQKIILKNLQEVDGGFIKIATHLVPILFRLS
jgi:hypothetical protein